MQLRDKAGRAPGAGTECHALDETIERVASRLLILEDDYGLRTSLRLVMEDEGYQVVEAADAETALREIAEAPVDLMLVDLMLGGIDGFTFIRRARPTTSAAIVVLSARDAPTDVVAALEAGADDYVRKPFDVDEVKARLRAVTRRPAVGDAATGEGQPAYVLDGEHGPLVFDPVAAVLQRGDQDLHLTHTEYKLLTTLVGHAGQVLTRGQLLESVWEGGHFGDERVVDVHVRRLRTKIEVDPGAPAVLVTVRGLGYRLDPR